MSLATRCPACGTAFRVVQDQLRVSGGWVRCGMCQQVFNGLEALIADPATTAPIDESPGPDAQPPQAPPPAAPPPMAPPERHAAPEAPRSVIPTGEAWEADAGWSMFGPGPGVGAAESRSGDSLPAPSLPPSDFDPVLRGVTLPPGGHGGISTFGEVTAATSKRPASSRPPQDTDLRVDPPPSGRRRRRRKPSFMRQAEREAQWRTPAMRGVLGLTAVLLATVLALQVLHHERDRLAAHWPASEPLLRAWCDLARCRIEPLRAIQQLAIDSSTLQRTAAPDVLRFEADLRNQATHAVRAPDLELSFTDNQGRLLARRVLSAQALEAPSGGIPSEGHWAVRAELRVRDLPVTGFSAELFYP